MVQWQRTCLPMQEIEETQVQSLGSIPGSGRSLAGGNSNPLQYSCLENSHGQRSLVGYSPWRCQRSDTTACQCMHTHTHTQTKEGPQPNMSGDLIGGILETEAHTGGMPGEMKAETYKPRNTNDCQRATRS